MGYLCFPPAVPVTGGGDLGPGCWNPALRAPGSLPGSFSSTLTQPLCRQLTKMNPTRTQNDPSACDQGWLPGGEQSAPPELLPPSQLKI